MCTHDWKVARSAIDPDKMVVAAEQNAQFQYQFAQGAGDWLAVLDRAKSQFPINPARRIKIKGSTTWCTP